MAWAQRSRKRRTEGMKKRGNRSWLQSLLRWNEEITLPWPRWRSSMNSGWVQRGKKANHDSRILLNSAILLLSRRIWQTWSARRKSWWKLVLFLWGATWWRLWWPLSLRPCWTAPRSNQRTLWTMWCLHAVEHESFCWRDTKLTHTFTSVAGWTSASEQPKITWRNPLMFYSFRAAMIVHQHYS